MTNRQFEALQQRVLRLVDDPQEQRKLLLQALTADIARLDQVAAKAQHAFESKERRSRRFKFLLEGVAELRPDIRLDEVTSGQLIGMVESTHPDLAHQLRELLGQ